MAKPSKVLRPFTPVRKLFLGLFKPKRSQANAVLQGLGKRRRVRDPTSPDATSASPTPLLSPKPLLMALQHDDLSSDAIIITGLDTLPFCCHEDLITMTRPQLIRAALALNEKLPAIMHIDVNPSRPDSFIRNSIEVIVGLKRNAPPAPKSLRLHTIDLDPEADISPPISPLAARSRSHDYHFALGGARLAKLDEEDEEMDVVERPAKKRKVSASSAASVSAVIDKPPSCLLRTQSQSHCVPPSASRTGRAKGFQRSQSLALANNKIDTTFITTTRPRYRFRSKYESGSDDAVKTSTPVSKQPNQFLSPQALEGATNTSTSSAGAGEHSFMSSLSLEEVGGVKRQRSVEGEEEEGEVTFGIDGMTIAHSLSDMDISMG
jgi:hypothetical protein